jgi:hypothetical protein
VKSGFPVSTDSLEDLVELVVNQKDKDLADSLMRTSWCLATVAAWCVILGLSEHYSMLSRGASDTYKTVCAQLWHPTSDWPERWYFEQALEQGETEAPYALLPSSEAMKQRIAEFLERKEYDWIVSSPTYPVGLWALDFIACRHFRMPVPASGWYRLLDGNAGA